MLAIHLYNQFRCSLHPVRVEVSKKRGYPAFFFVEITLENLTWVHKIVRVKHGLDAAHQLDFGFGSCPVQIFLSLQADAVFR